MIGSIEEVGQLVRLIGWLDVRYAEGESRNDLSTLLELARVLATFPFAV